MRVLRSPVVQFLLIGAVTLVGVGFVTSHFAARSAEEEAIAEARGTTEVLGRTVVAPSVPAGLRQPKPVAVDQLDRELDRRMLGLEELTPAVERAIVWSREGDQWRAVYVVDPRGFNTSGILLRTFDLTPDHLTVLRGGSGATSSRSADPGSPENRGVDGISDQVRIYTRIDPAETGPLLFEAFYSLAELEDRRSEIYGSFRLVTLGGPALLLVLVAPLLHVLTRQLTRAGHERERLLHTAIDASDAERRRIARDLHDGVVQDLAGTTYSISAVARDPGVPGPARSTLAGAGDSLRTALKSLRSLLAEIHPPDLQADGLASALADLTAPAAAAGIAASVSVEGAETASDRAVRLVWRVAQEAVRNAIRHSACSTLAVTVRITDECLVLEVVDDGEGFDVHRPRDPQSFGLRGLASLVADAGGELTVRSAPGEGTTVRMEVTAS